MIPLAKTTPKEYVIYNYDIRQQSLSFLYRGDKIPVQYCEYKPLWRLCDKDRQIETIIISV
ncbi:MAG: hypothetical protein WCR28_04385 [Candidatus Izemoplasmatales bacterium]|nr:hypothetical protein [Candidatus Izemoplasmatales bacterium]MDD4988364.1 hypothetical protein [Candidatus Izemoplasmatales bacterium]